MRHVSMTKSPENPSPQRRRRRRAAAAKATTSQPAGKWLWENFKSLAGAVVIYLVREDALRRGVSHSVGEHDPHAARRRLAVREQARLRADIPFTNSHLPGFTNPKRSDVVVFVSPYQADNAPDFTPTLVKRLIGMPGDTLYMRDGVLYLNGIAQRQGFAANNPTAAIQHAADAESSSGSTRSSSKGSRFGPRPRSRRSTTGDRSSFPPITIS